MEKYIKVSDAIKTFEALSNCDNGYSDTYDKATIIGVLEAMPPVETKIVRYWHDDLRRPGFLHRVIEVE